MIQVKSYENDTSTGDVKISLSEAELQTFKGRDILIVEDIVDTGRTMTALLKKLKEYEPASVRVVSLLVKRTSRSNDYVPDYVGFYIPDLFVVGYLIPDNHLTLLDMRWITTSGFAIWITFASLQTVPKPNMLSRKYQYMS